VGGDDGLEILQPGLGPERVVHGVPVPKAPPVAMMERLRLHQDGVLTDALGEDPDPDHGLELRADVARVGHALVMFLGPALGRESVADPIIYRPLVRHVDQVDEQPVRAVVNVHLDDPPNVHPPILFRGFPIHGEDLTLTLTLPDAGHLDLRKARDPAALGPGVDHDLEVLGRERQVALDQARDHDGVRVRDASGESENEGEGENESAVLHDVLQSRRDLLFVDFATSGSRATSCDDAPSSCIHSH